MGTQMTINRRGLLASGGLGLLAAGAPAWATAPLPPIPPRVVDLVVSPTRSTKLVSWTPARPRGVALLSTGHGSWPERYQAIAGSLVEQGFAVLAPVHVDSMHYPERDSFTLQAGFGERLADMAATAAHAARAHPGLPVIAAGHSFGTLTALCLAGGLPYAGATRLPAVKAVLGFSTPGRIPGLVQPTAYATVAVPLMVIAGTDDRVPGFVTDPADHLFPVETAPAPAYGLVIAGGGHELVAATTPAYGHASTPARLFVDAYGLGNGDALRRLGAWRPEEGDRWIKRT